MRPTTLLGSVLAGLAVLTLSVACGGDDDGDDARTARPTRDETTTSTTVEEESSTTTAPGGGGGEVDAAISLDITVTADTQSLRQGSLTCGATATGTGHLADPAAAEAACELLRDNAEARRRLVEGRRQDLMCTQVYGGPEVARVQGTIDGQPVDATIDRTDGCGIADWQNLTPLLGQPGV